MIQGIKTIIFDLGGVILNIDYQLTQQAFIDLGFTDFEKKYTQFQQSAFFDDFETGKTSSEEFVAEIQPFLNSAVAKADIIAAWNAMLLDFPLRRLQLLQQLQLHYNTFILSNTNALHEAAFQEKLRKQTGFPGLGVLVDKAYFSHRIGMRKPHPEVFKWVLEQNGLEAQSTLFIDDSPQHIEGAKQAGLQTIWLEKHMTIEENVFKSIHQEKRN